MNVDEILAEIMAENDLKKKDDDKESTNKKWSMNEIDDLLGIAHDDNQPKKNSSFSPPDSTVVIELADDKPEFEKIRHEKPVEQETIRIPDEIEQKTREVPSVEKAAIAQKTVGIQPVFNESIEHQIMGAKLESSGGMETDEYREKFLNRPVQKLERTADYEKVHDQSSEPPVERPGMIIKKSKFNNTADLEPIPTIISAEEERNKARSQEEQPIPDGVAGQIKLTGFEEEMQIDQIDEENAEELLRQKRNEKIKEFRLETNLDEEEEIPDEIEYEGEYLNIASDYIDDEYIDKSDKGKIQTALEKGCRNSLILGTAQFALFIASFIINIIVMKAGGSLDTVGGSIAGNMLINSLLLIGALMLGISTIIRGFSGIIPFKPNASTGVVVVGITALLQLIVTFIAADDSYIDVNIYAPVAILAFSLSSFSRYIVLKRAKENFEFITNGTKLYSSEMIKSNDDAFEIGRGLLIGEPDICYSSKIRFPSSFIDLSFVNDPADGIANKTVPAIAGLSIIAGIIGGIVGKSLLVAFAIIAGICAIAIPSFSIIATNLSLLLTNKKFNKIGAMISGYTAVSESTDINAVVLDSTDLFRKGSCSIIGIKMFHNMRIDEAIIYTAALVIESGGPLGDIFGDVILGKKELLPPVESLAYEERLGLSAWIHGRRILVGSRDLLINHNVAAPDKDFEIKYTHDGRKVMYLAIAGKIAAMFVIKYNYDRHIEKCLKGIDKTGLTILVRSNDYNITEEMICRYFKLPISAVKVLTPVSGDIFQKYRAETLDSAKAKIIHNGTIESFISTLLEARVLHENSLMNKLVTLIYMVITILIFGIIGITAGLSQIGAPQIVLFQLIWGTVAILLPIMRNHLKR